MKKRLILTLSFIMMILFVLPFGNVNVKAADERRVVYIAGYEISGYPGTFKTITDEDFGGHGIVEGTIEYSVYNGSSSNYPYIKMDGFKFNFERAKELGVEIPSTFIRSNVNVYLTIVGNCSFSHETLAQNGIVLTDGASLEIHTYSSWDETDILDIQVQYFPLYVEGNVVIDEPNLQLRSYKNYATAVAGGIAEWNESKKTFDFLSCKYGTYTDYKTHTTKTYYNGLDLSKMTQNSTFTIADSNYPYGSTIKFLQPGEPDGYYSTHPEIIVASGDVNIANYDSTSLDISSEDIYAKIISGKSVNIMGNLTINPGYIKAKENITVYDGAVVRCHAATSGTLDAGETIKINNAKVLADIECDSHNWCRDYSSDIIKAKNIVIKKYSELIVSTGGIGINASESIYIEDSEVYVSANNQSGTDDGGWDIILMTAINIDIISSNVETNLKNYCYSYFGMTQAISAESLTITNNSVVNASVEASDSHGDYDSTLCAIKADKIKVTDNSVLEAYNNKRHAIESDTTIYIDSSQIIAKTDGEGEYSNAINAPGIKGDYSVLSGNNSSNTTPGLNDESSYIEIYTANFIKLKPVINGSVVISSNVIRPSGEAHKGDVISFILLPEEGYVVDTINVYNYNDINEIVSLNNNSFIMPGFDVGVEVTFKKLPVVVLQYEETSEDLSVESSEVPEAKPIAGKVFMGWYDDEECTVPHDFANPLTDGVTLYAKYEAMPEGVGDITNVIEATKTELKVLIDDKEDTEAIEKKIIELKLLISSLRDNMNTQNELLKEEINKIINETNDTITKAYQEAINNSEGKLKQLIDDKANSSDVNNQIAELKRLIDGVKDYVDAQELINKNEINQTINTATTTITNAYKEEIKNVKEELQKLIDSKADSETVLNTITTLQNAISSLEEMKNNYVDADVKLKAELEVIIEQAKLEAIESAKGYIPYIGTNGNWWISDKDTGVKATGNVGETGVGISKIEKTETNKNVDTYTITMTDGSVHIFTVTNGNTLTYIIPIVISVIALLTNIAFIVLILKKKKEIQ